VAAIILLQYSARPTPHKEPQNFTFIGGFVVLEILPKYLPCI
jgi:hypothetical protein